MKRVAIIGSSLIIFLVAIIIVFFLLFPRKYIDEIDKYSTRYNLSNYMVASIINIESGYDLMAHSSADAMGLMQLKLTTAMDMARGTGIDIDNVTIYDKDINIMLGCKYMSYLLDMFDGNETNALASYNWGLTNVKEWIASGNRDESGTIENIPVRETREYLKKYKLNRFVYKNIYRL